MSWHTGFFFVLPPFASIIVLSLARFDVTPNNLL
jgi:hypothetical protein